MSISEDIILKVRYVPRVLGVVVHRDPWGKAFLKEGSDAGYFSEASFSSDVSMLLGFSHCTLVEGWHSNRGL